MFGNLFGRKTPEVGTVDVVWLSDAARLRGMRRDAEVLIEDGNSLVLVAFTLAHAEQLAAVFADLNPVRCMSAVDERALREQLVKAGAVTLALSGALPSSGTPTADVPVEILAFGRNERRQADEAVIRAAPFMGRAVHVSYHLSLDDHLMRAHAANMKPILEKLGMNDDESITHEYVTKAIRNAQKP